jgi:hypothetical protein
MAINAQLQRSWETLKVTNAADIRKSNLSFEKNPGIIYNERG